MFLFVVLVTFVPTLPLPRLLRFSTNMRSVGSLVPFRNLRVRVHSVLGACLREFLFSEVRHILYLHKGFGGFRRIIFSMHGHTSNRDWEAGGIWLICGQPVRRGARVKSQES